MKSLIEKITIGDYDIEEQYPWPVISEEAKDLIKKLLELDPEKRLTATQALHHPWITEEKKGAAVSIYDSLKASSEASFLTTTRAKLRMYSEATIKERRIARLTIETTAAKLPMVSHYQLKKNK